MDFKITTMKYLKYSVLIFLFIACDSNSDNASSSEQEVGQGGSLARFAIVTDYLYTVDEYDLNVFSVSDTTSPVFLNKIPVGFRIETLFAYQGNLFIGSESAMFIFNLNNPEIPLLESSIQHFTSCDPVVVKDNFAYVTLHDNSNCGNGVNLLEIYDVTDIGNPILIEQRNMLNPKGLGIFNNYLLVCDDEIKVFDISDPQNMSFVQNINVNGFDIIVRNNHLFIIGSAELNQYTLDPMDISNVTHLSTVVF